MNQMTKRKRTHLCLTLTTLVLLLSIPVHPAPAGAFEIVPVTDDDRSDAFPSVSGPHIAWQTCDGEDWEIVYYRDEPEEGSGEPAEPVLITDDSFDDMHPVVSPDGADGARIAWFKFDGADDEVYLYETASASIRRISNRSHDDRHPHLAGDLLVWQGSDGAQGGEGDQGGGGADEEIFVHDIALDETVQVTWNSYRDRSPRTDGTTVVWRGDPGGEGLWAIYAWDPVSGVTRRLSWTGGDCWSPTVEGRWVAWYGRDGGESGDMEVYLYDLLAETGQQVTSNRDDDSRIVLHDGRLLWRTCGPGVGMPGHNFLTLLDIATDERWRITITGTTEIYEFSVDGIWVAISVFEEVRVEGKTRKDSEVFVYNVQGETLTQLSDNLTPDRLACISGDRVVWIGSDGIDGEVMMAVLPATGRQNQSRSQALPGNAITGGSASNNFEPQP